jgi:hypothetical protein
VTSVYWRKLSVKPRPKSPDAGTVTFFVIALIGELIVIAALALLLRSALRAFGRGDRRTVREAKRFTK